MTPLPLHPLARLQNVLFALLMFPALCAFADPDVPLRGAKVIMAEWAPPAETAERRPTTRSASSSFESDFARYRSVAHQLSPNEAAQQWLAFVDRYNRASGPVSSVLIRKPELVPDFNVVLAGLPPTAAWPQLALLIRQRPIREGSRQSSDLALHLLAARLVADHGEEARLRSHLLELVTTSPRTEPDQELASLLRHELMDTKAEVEDFTAQLEQVEHKASDPLHYTPPLRVPDLVNYLGVDQAKPLIVRALLSSAAIDTTKGRETEALVAACALEIIARLPRPRWELTRHLGSPDLFEAMEKRFGAPVAASVPSTLALPQPPGDSALVAEYKRAAGYYLLNLLLAGRESDAVNRALSIGTGQMTPEIEAGANALAQQGHAAEVATFLHGVLLKRPNLLWWDTYVDVAARAGQSAEALAALRSALEQSKVSPEVRISLRKHLAQALLADDQVDAGISELKSNMSVSVVKDELHEDPNNPSEEAARSLLKLGIALERADLVTAAAETLERRAAQPINEYEAESVAEDLISAKRYSAAESLLAAAIARQIKSNDEYRSPDASSLLSKLVALYAQTGRHEDVLALMDNAPFWGAMDAADISTYSSEPLLSVATALTETGAGARALPLIETLLKTDAGNDKIYELLLKAAPTDLEHRLEALAAADHFEERPFIWKADVLRRAGRLEEAEQACRAAIAIDPSDGEEPAGDRLRVYAVLAEIRETRGDKVQAETYRRVVRAIRMAEHADTLYRAGLLKRAIALYDEALSIFSDAYCIQSRLAVRLAESGKLKEAEEHYLRAYELMPESFGRVESHCFGCEHAFGPEHAQNIAERVFTRIAAEHPDNPKVFYLLGYLRHEQNRDKEALVHFEHATRLDPEYLNAWKKISELGSRIDLPPETRDAAALAILRLDPNGHHSSPDYSSVRDLRALFEYQERINPDASARGPIYPLRASAEALRKRGISDEDDAVRRQVWHPKITAEQIVRSHRLFKLVMLLTSRSAVPQDVD